MNQPYKDGALSKALQLVPKDRRREFVTTSEMDRWFLVDWVRSNYIVQRKGFKGHKDVAYAQNGLLCRRYRPIDVLAFAVVNGWEIGTPESASARLGNVNKEIAGANTRLMEIRRDIAAAERELGAAQAKIDAVNVVGLSHNIGCAGLVGASIKQIVCEAYTSGQVGVGGCGVYFLVEGGEVVYVGQSVNVFSRVASHIQEGRKKFSAAAWIPVPKDRLNFVESFYIHTIEPRYNGGEGSDRVCAPFSKQRLHEVVTGGVL